MDDPNSQTAGQPGAQLAALIESMLRHPSFGRADMQGVALEGDEVTEILFPGGGVLQIPVDTPINAWRSIGAVECIRCPGRNQGMAEREVRADGLENRLGRPYLMRTYRRCRHRLLVFLDNGEHYVR